MDTDFLREIIPKNEGFFFLVGIPDQGKGRVFHAGYFSSRPDTALSFQRRPEIGDHYGISFTPWTYTQREWAGKKHPRSIDAMRLTSQSVWIDIDVGDGEHKYPSIHDALSALITATTDTAMPHPSQIVCSGGGVHAYWVLTQPVDLPTWRPIASRLRAYFDAAGVTIDGSVTEDAARVMRLPGTENRKLAEPRPCRVLTDAPGHGNRYSLDIVDGWPELPEAKPAAQKAITGLFDSSAAETVAPAAGGEKRWTGYIVQRCNVFRRISVDEGASCSEVLWKDVLQTVTMTEDARPWAHALSRGHAGYSAQSTDQKLAERSLGKAITCAQFGKHFDSENHPCEGCALHGKGASPLRLGTAPAAQVTQPDPSKPALPAVLKLPGQPAWASITSKGIAQRVADDEPDVFISRSEITGVSALQEWIPGGYKAHLRISHCTGGQDYSEVLALDDLASSSEAQKAMHRVALSVPAQGFRGMTKLFQTWDSTHVQPGDVTFVSSRQGWMQGGNFALGDTMYFDSGDTATIEAIDGSQASAIYSPQGDLAPWQAAAQAIVDSGSEPLKLLIAASLGCPLAYLLGASGHCASLSLYSVDSGVGKSTALRVARSIWAQPNSFSVLDDTYNGVMAMLASAPHLPLIWDDPRRQKTRQDLRELLFQLTSGRTKQRAQQDGKAAPTVLTHTMGIVASNEPLIGELSQTTGVAEAKRVIEIAVNQAPLDTPPEVFSALDDNYGRAGAAFLAHVVPRRKEIKSLLQGIRKQATEDLSSGADDRFFMNTITVCIAAAHIAKEIGLIDLLPGDLFQYFRSVLDKSRLAAGVAMDEHSCVSQVLAFLATPGVYGGVVKKRHSGRYMNNEVLAQPPDRSQPWHYVVDNARGHVRLSVNRFKQWYFDQPHRLDLNMDGWCDRAYRDGVLVSGKRRMSLALGPYRYAGCDQQLCVEVLIPALVDATIGHNQMPDNSASYDDVPF